MASGSSAATSSWMRFFTEAGIPEHVAANYAITFADHRIAMSMLLDLNKEILHDVGVTVMGDVIAVLKHAKVVHERVAREKLLKTQSPVVSVAPVLTNRVTPATSSEVVAPTAAAVSRRTAPGRIVLKRKVDGTGAVSSPPLPKALSSARRYVAPVASSAPAVTVAKPRLVVSQRSRPAAASSKPSVFNRLDEKPGAVVKDAPKSEAIANSVFDRLGPGQSDVVPTKGPKDRKLEVRLKVTDSPKTKVLTVNEAKKRFPTLAQKVARASKQTHGILGHGGPSTDRVRKSLAVARSSREEPGGRREPSGSSNVFGRLGPRE